VPSRGRTSLASLESEEIQHQFNTAFTRASGDLRVRYTREGGPVARTETLAPPPSVVAPLAPSVTPGERTRRSLLPYQPLIASDAERQQAERERAERARELLTASSSRRRELARELGLPPRETRLELARLLGFDLTARTSVNRLNSLLGQDGAFRLGQTGVLTGPGGLRIDTTKRHISPTRSGSGAYPEWAKDAFSNNT
jgi:hypothetical protein